MYNTKNERYLGTLIFPNSGPGTISLETSVLIVMAGCIRFRPNTGGDRLYSATPNLVCMVTQGVGKKI